MTHPMALEVFEPLINTQFNIALEPTPLKLTLAEIVKQERSPAKYECFTLLFKGPLNPALEQQIYKFEHENASSWDLFVVPVAGDDEGYDYEVVVNRQIQE